MGSSPWRRPKARPISKRAVPPGRDEHLRGGRNAAWRPATPFIRQPTACGETSIGSSGKARPISKRAAWWSHVSIYEEGATPPGGPLRRLSAGGQERNTICLALHLGRDLGPGQDLAFQDGHRQRIFDVLLDGPAQRAGAVDRIVAALGQKLAGPVGQEQFQVLVGQAPVQAPDLDVPRWPRSGRPSGCGR